MSEFALHLSTAIKPAKKIKVDEDVYEFLGLEHLSDADESLVVALLARYGVLSEELSACKNVGRGQALADEWRKTRVAVIAKVTTIPKAVIEKLDPAQQIAALEAIQGEFDDAGALPASAAAAETEPETDWTS